MSWLQKPPFNLQEMALILSKHFLVCVCVCVGGWVGWRVEEWGIEEERRKQKG